MSWGGGKPRAWSGAIRVEPLAAAGGSPIALEWRALSGEADVAATLLDADGGIRVAEQRPRSGGGVELVVPEWRRHRLMLRLVPDGDERGAVVIELPLADAVAEGLQRPLDRDGNRLVIRSAPGDALRASVTPAAGRGSQATIFRPGDVARVTVEPLLPRRAAGTAGVELRLRLKPAADADPILSRTATLVPRAEAAGDEGASRSEEYEPVSFEVPLPPREGAYDIDLEAVERGGLRWSRQLAARTIQLAAVAADPPDPSWRGEQWRLVHELDPGSPRLHERLRRLPAAGLAAVPVPKMPLPQMPLPSMSLPQVPLPKLANVPVPGMGLPNVSAMMPRFSGLLTTGHSTVEVHPLGAMLRLPPARSADEPAWEGIVIAGVQPGLPHLVEIEHPLDHRALLAVCVLEPDASGALVEPRSGCGIAVEPGLVPAGDATGRLGRHAFVFWPVSRNPLVLVANPSTTHAALFGRVRVSAGPLRPPPSDAAVAAPPAAGGRRVHAFLPAPDFERFGATERTAAGVGRPFADWRTFLSGAARAAEWTAAQGAAGAMVVAYRDGGAIWPSRATRGSARWDSGAAADVALDPVPKDLLGLLCRVHAREGLRLLPALSFDAPLPDVEQLLVGDAAAARGLVIVGRDGRPRRTDGGRTWHYNPLDPRVQEAVESVVRELAGRLRGETAVDGAGIVLSHEGWLHLPGIAAGLDDVTFSRFLSETGGQEPAALGDRFARRAALVEGAWREVWLAWRGANLAAFHARLARILAAADPRFVLHVVPTTLLVEGDLARRFRPTLAPPAEAADFWREIGVDPGLLTADPRIVFAAPHVHGAGDSLLERVGAAEAERSADSARGIARATRRSAVMLERSTTLSCADVVPHGPFGTAAAPAPVPVHLLPPDAERCRGLAESLAVSDVETVFDMRLLLACVEPRQAAALRGFATLPAGTLDTVARCAEPLVVRSGAGDGATHVCLANAGPVACRAVVALAGAAADVTDAAAGGGLPLDPAGSLAVPLGPWEVRALRVAGGATVAAARAVFEPAVSEAIAGRLADLRGRRAAIETPRPLDVLDNPGFELAGAGEGGDAALRAGAGVSGWDLVDPGRGRLAIVPGVDGPAGRAVAFASDNGLATLRSNPFTPPANGRISVAMWLRIGDGDPQPPVRLAIEGVLDDREYYRFAPVGGLGGGKPLSATWSQFVLQIDDLPSRGLDSLRVRVDLLGPGSVQLDGVRVFDLAFDESQRVRLSRRLAVMEERLAAGDAGACLVELDGYWPRFLVEHVSDDAVAAARQAFARDAAPAAESPPASPVRSGSMLDRLRRWWQ